MLTRISYKSFNEPKYTTPICLYINDSKIYREFIGFRIFQTDIKKKQKKNRFSP